MYCKVKCTVQYTITVYRAMFACRISGTSYSVLNNNVQDYVWIENFQVHYIVYSVNCKVYCTVLYTRTVCRVMFAWRTSGKLCSVNSTVLYCTVLYCNVLYCTVLVYSVLYCTLLYCAVPRMPSQFPSLLWFLLEPKKFIEWTVLGAEQCMYNLCTVSIRCGFLPL